MPIARAIAQERSELVPRRHEKGRLFSHSVCASSLGFNDLLGFVCGTLNRRVHASLRDRK